MTTDKSAHPKSGKAHAHADKGRQAEHSMTQTDRVTTFYPPHPARVATDVYIASHHELCMVQNKPCWACGIAHTDCVARSSELKGVVMETHHFWTEDAFTGEGGGLGGIFWVRVMADHADFDWKGCGFDAADPSTYKFFVDSTYNLQVLCSACHRAARPVLHWLAGRPDPNRGNLVWPPNAGSIGIHHANYPVYRDQRHSRPDTPPFLSELTERIAVPQNQLRLADQKASVEAQKTPMVGHELLPPT